MVFYRNVWITLLFSLAFVYGDPVRTGTGGRVETIGRDLFNSFDDVTDFVRTWFARIHSRVHHILNDGHERDNHVNERRILTKREIKPPPNFELVERDYLMFLSNQYLDQLFDYAKYINHSNETRATLDRVLSEEIARLQRMTTEELKVYCAKLQAAMAHGINLNHEITVNGQTYSLESIAQVCCPWG
ncbi:uncharacterized protein [Mytilus edulis]|uniref:uncharacterized protein n=1 Tax=Mytilus edulis TaxID=6550 RepID=UPI0039EEE6B8